jgi:hypothetical protein
MTHFNLQRALPTKKTAGVGVCYTAPPANAYVVSSGESVKVNVTQGEFGVPVS